MKLASKIKIIDEALDRLYATTEYTDALREKLFIIRGLYEVDRIYDAHMMANEVLKVL